MAESGERRPRNSDRRGTRRKREEPSVPEADPIIKGEWSYAVRKVEETKVRGGVKKSLYIGPGKVLSEDQFPFLRDHEKGMLLALHVKAGKPVTYSFAERLGKAGTIAAELARHGYLTGNGDVFPQPVQAEVDAIEKEGQGMIDKELQEKNLRSANGVDWRTEYKHGRDRIDFRGMKDRYGKDAHVMTIDPDTARDYDDALHARAVEVNGKDYVEIGVHIADVTHFLSAIDGKPGSAMFTEAMLRSFTAYFPGQAFTMLPRILADKLCSLEPDVNRLALSTVFLIDPATGSIDDNLTWIGEGVIRSGRRFTYKEAEDLRTADSGASTKENELRDAILLLEKYGDVQRKEREERKSASFPPSDELDASFDPRTGKSIARNKESYKTNLIVEDWMLSTGAALAILTTRIHEATGGRFPTILRYHEPPTLDELQEIAERFDATEIVDEIRAHRSEHPVEEAPKIGDTEAPFPNRIVDKLFALSLTFELSEPRKQAIRDAVEATGESHPYYDADPDEKERKIQQAFLEWRDINRDWLRQAIFSLFKKARYTTDPSIHFGLSLFPYTHATSPIRRFNDVLVHSLAKAALSGDIDALPEVLRPESIKKIAMHMNAREILIREASEDAERMWGAHLLSDKIGSQIRGQVLRFRRKKIGSGNRYGPRSLELQIKLEGGYRMLFDIPVDKIEDLPHEAAVVNNLIGHEITFELLGTDPATGLLNLKFVSAPEEAMRVPLSFDEAAFLKSYLETKIGNLEGQFREVLVSNKTLERQLKRLKTTVGTLTAKTPSNIVDQWAEDLGVISMRLHKAGRLIPDAPVIPTVSRPSDVPLPAEPALPRFEPRLALRPTPPMDREARIAALEQAIEAIKRQRRIAELQRQIVEAKSRKR